MNEPPKQQQQSWMARNEKGIYVEMDGIGKGL
jgi:hypothetical protein